MSSNLTTLVILVTVLHVAVFVIMIMIRLRRDEPGTAGESIKIKPCAVCSEPATHLGYDGLDPDERHDPHTGRSYSIDMTHYQPLCATH